MLATGSTAISSLNHCNIKARVYQMFNYFVSRFLDRLLLYYRGGYVRHFCNFQFCVLLLFCFFSVLITYFAVVSQLSRV